MNSKLLLSVKLVCAVESNNLTEVEQLLTSGADVNFVNLHGKHETPLHEAVKAGSSEMVRLLLANGANWKARDGDGIEPVDLCSRLDDVTRRALVAVFSEHSANIVSRKALKRKHSGSEPGTSGTYTKRPGTANVGQFYETKLLTMVLFRLRHDDRIEQFYLGNNLDEAGAFDDIVLRTCEAGGSRSRVYCLQAKHKKAGHVVNFEDLANVKETKGDFLLRKYLESFLKIRYTFSAASDQEVFRVEYEQTELELVIFTPAVLRCVGDVQQCEMVSNCGIFQTKSTGKTLRIRANQELLDFFVDLSRQWHRKVIVDILAKLFLLYGYNTSNLPDAMKKLERDNVLSKLTSTNVNFDSSGLLQLYSNKQVMMLQVKTGKTYYDNVARMLQEPVLPSRDENVKIVKEFFAKLRFCSEQATEDELEGVIRSDVRACNIERDDIVYSKAHEFIESWWKQNGEVQFLTKSCNIFEKVATEIKIDKIQSIGLDKIRSNFIRFRRVEVVSPKWVNLSQDVKGGEPISVNIFSSTPELCCLKIMQYLQWHEIKFKFAIIDSARTKLTLEAYSKSHPDCLILVSVPNLFSKDIQEVLQSSSKVIIITRQKYPGSWRSIEDETKGLLDLETPCQEKLLDYPVDFQGFTIPLKKLLDRAPRSLIDAETLQKLVFGEKIAISNSCFSIEESPEECYIERVLLDNRQKPPIVKKISEICDTVIVVAAEPGMGKSTLLTGLATSIKELDPLCWIVRINLLYHSRRFHQWKAANVALDEMHAMNFLIEVTCCEQAESFGNRLFRWYCEQSKLYLLIDGFDEISPDYAGVVQQLLQIYKHNFTAYLWVTTRTGSAQKTLEKSLRIRAHSLKPFTAQQTKDYLWNFWKTKLKITDDCQNAFEDYVKQLLAHLSKSIGRGELELISVPLQMKMIAIIFQDHFSAFYCSNGSQPQFGSLNLVTLYENFIDYKFKVMVEEKNKTDLTKPYNRQLVRESFKQFQNNHRQAAIYTLYDRAEVEKLLMPELKVETVEEFLQEILCSEGKAGIITRISCGKPMFVHQTYAEFFAAQFVWEKYSSLRDTEFGTFVECVTAIILKHETLQVAKFLHEIAQKSIQDCQDATSKACVLLDKLLDVCPGSWREFTRTTLLCLLGLVECTINADNKRLEGIMSTVNSKPVNSRDMLLLKASESGHLSLVRAVTDGNADRIDVTFDWLEGWTALHMAANGGHKQTVRHLLGKSANIDSVTKENGQTALHVAAEKGHYGIVQLLLDNGASVDSSMTNIGITPLHLAAREGFAEVASILLNRGATVNSCTTVAGETALHIASGNGRLEVVQLLLQKGADVNSKTKQNGTTALHVAIKNDHLAIVRVLLENGSKVNAETTEFGYTPLHWAVRVNLLEVTSLLLGKGASIDSVSKVVGYTALHTAVLFGYDEMVRLLLENSANMSIGTKEEGWSPLHLAARNNFGKIATMLLERGADIDSTMASYGETPLHAAAERGHFEMVQLLVDRGANVNIATRDGGWTALHWAARVDFVEIIHILVEKGANIDCTALMVGRTPLIEASLYGAVNAIKVLLKLGANANLGTSDIAQMPIHLAAQKNYPDIIKMLVDHGANIDCTITDYGRTPLYETVLYGSVNAANILLELGANVHLATTDKAYSPLHMAAQKDNLEIMRMLIDKGANVNCTTIDDGRTPLYEASLYGAPHAVKILLEMGANVHLATTDKAYSSLHVAARGDNPEIIRLLVSNGANVNCVTTNHGKTPLYEALLYGSLNVAKILLELGGNVHLATTDKAYSTLHMAAQKDNLEILRMLIDKGANVNCTTIDDGRTPLYEASLYGAPHAVKILLEMGANVHLATTDKAYSPLHVSAREDNPEIIRLLVSNGANVNCVTTNQGETPLYIASLHGRINVAKILLEMGANVNQGTYNKTMPMHMAARSNCPEIIRMLINEEVDYDCVNNDGYSPLHMACIYGSEDAAKLLLDMGARVNLKTTYTAYSPLHRAAMKNSQNIIQMLIDKGANINSTTVDGRTPLYAAVKFEAVNAVIQLLENGAKVNLGSTDIAYTPIHWAARKNNTKVIEMFIKKGANIDCASTDVGRTPLYEAMCYGALDAVNLFLQMGANVNLATTDMAYAPIHCAARKNYPEMIRTLIMYGANVDCTTTDYGRTPLYEASYYGSLKAAKELLANGANFHLGTTDAALIPLHCAAQKNYPEIIKLLVEHGANVNCTTADVGRTPLYEASFCGAANAVESLLGLGANVHLGTTDIAYTPLHCAARHDFPGIVKMLIAKGAHVDCITSDFGRTPLFEASYSGAVNAVEQLLDLGANVNLGTTKIAYKPIHCAAQKNLPDIIIKLVERGANVDCRTSDVGRTPLMEAAMHGAVNAVKTLLHLGANVHLSMEDNALTPLHLAAQNDCPDIITLLVENGANVDCPTAGSGRTPLFCASIYGAENAAKTLLDLGADPTSAGQSRHARIEQMLHHATTFHENATKVLQEATVCTKQS